MNWNCNGSLPAASYNALWDLYNSTNGTHWTWSTQLPASTIWTFPSNLSTPCSDHWQGLVCSREPQETCSLEGIDLSSYGLSGYLPSLLGSVASLKGVKFSGNRLSGPIPSELGNLRFLTGLYLDSNSLSGTIPSELGNLTSAKVFDLSSNRLNGTIPLELKNLNSLEVMYLDSNKLTGELSGLFDRMPKLSSLDLSENRFSGSILEEVVSLKALLYLNVHENLITGTIPGELGNLPFLVEFALYYNHLSGTIPSELGNLPFLVEFELGGNRLSGTIPSELGNLRFLTRSGLDLDSNSLSGTIPSELGNLRFLAGLYLESNSLSGTIPSELGNLTSAKLIDLSSNRLTGTIPLELKNLNSLEVMLLDSNKLAGELNGLFDRMPKLSSLDLSENRFSGSILEEVVSLNALSYLNMEQNLITGTIPLWMNSSSLQQLEVSLNFITGEIAGLTNLSDVFAAHNLLTGSLPESFFSIVLESWDLSENFLSGAIGQQFSKCSNLTNIALGGNSLSGTIPHYLSNLPLLVSFNLSNNELIGDLEAFSVSSTSLQVLDISSNRLSGTLPSQLFQLKSLQDILLYSNCFSGSLPETICSNPSLEYFVMNDLTSNCGSGIPKSLRPIFRGAVSQRLMSGSIPDCVWGMTGLKLLQLSGNGLTGSIGESRLVNRNNSLLSLLLSGNQLTGTIPEWIQTSSILQQLDLSQNRLSGTLLGSLMIPSTSSLFRASVNRLSGDLPDVLFSTSSNLTLDVLNGNQFSCSSAGGVAGWGSILSPSNMPQSDVNRDNYVCGSSLFDNYLLFATVCFLVLVIVVAFIGLMCKKLFEMVSFRDRRYTFTFNRSDLINQLVMSIALLILFVSLHSPPLAQFSTHSKQYLWITTAAFLRGWAPVLIILLAVGIGETVITMTHGGKDTTQIALSSRNDILLSPELRFRLMLSFACVHILNIVAVLATNATYVLATVDGLPFDQLFVVQLSLGCFKLAWSGVVIPWLLRYSSKNSNVTIHRTFMSLFTFIGGPLISTFFTASSCFLYILISPKPVSSTIIVPQYSCSQAFLGQICEDDSCSFSNSYTCQFQPVTIATTSIPSWTYSYQCSSTLLLNYVPVMIASMAISGFLLPCFVLSQFAFTGTAIVSWLNAIAPRSMLVGDAFEVAQLNRFLQAKTLINLTTVLTFGFACPLLGVLIVWDSLIWSWMRQMLITHSNNVAASVDQPEFTTSLETLQFFTVLNFVGVFWSLFVFDMIGDVYGDLSGGLSILASVLLGAVILLAKRFRRAFNVSQSISRSVTTPGLELCDQFTQNALQSPQDL